MSLIMTNKFLNLIIDNHVQDVHVHTIKKMTFTEYIPTLIF